MLKINPLFEQVCVENVSFNHACVMIILKQCVSPTVHKPARSLVVVVVVVVVIVVV